MKKIKMMICAALALLTVLSPLFISCKEEVSETEEATETAARIETAEITTEAQTEPVIEKGMILIDNGVPNFTFSVSFGKSEPAKKAADELTQKFKKNIRDRYGCDLPDSARYKVSADVLAISNTKIDWAMEANEKGLNIMGCAADGVKNAVDMFFRLFTNGASKTLVIPEDLSISYLFARDRIDNSSFLSYIPTEEVKLLDTFGNGKVMSPEWTDSLIMTEVRVVTATIGGKLKNSYDLIDHYAEFGVNCIWLDPIYEYGPGGNGYGSTGPHRIGENLTGEKDQEKGWEEMRKFVDYAHEKGIYIVFDVITWGVMKNSELTQTHPEWFSGEAWDNAAFDWKNEELYEWFISVCVENIMKTGADGFRCDCEPNYTGYGLFGEVRKRLAEQGKHIIIISEDGTSKKQTYDFEQDGVLWYDSLTRAQLYQEPVVWYVDGGLDIIESVKNGVGLGSQQMQSGRKAGTSKYYTNCITNHDYQKRVVCGNRLNIGYAAIMAPFIPLWYMGDEFNAKWQHAVQYDVVVNYDDIKLPENLKFSEDVKKMIRVRRTYKEIFEYWADNHRNANICEVELDEWRGLSAYARYAGNKAVLVIPNNDENAPSYVTAKVPFEECGISGYEKYRVTDLWTDTVLYEGAADGISKISAYVPYRNFTMLLIEGI